VTEQLLSGGDLAYVRSQAGKALPDTCHIEERQLTQDGRGGMAEAWAIAYTDVRCRFSTMPEHAREGLLANRNTAGSMWLLTLPYDQSIDETMRVIHGGNIYQVSFVNDAESYDTTRRCQLQLV
jgi:SPP1 family predicted phage head-tail adaptor